MSPQLPSDPRDYLDADRPPTGEPPIPERPTAAPGKCICKRYYNPCINDATLEDLLCNTCRPQCYSRSAHCESGKFRGSCYGPRCSTIQHEPKLRKWVTLNVKDITYNTGSDT